MKIHVFELSETVSGEQFLIDRLVNNFGAKKIILWDYNKNCPKIKMNSLIYLIYRFINKISPLFGEYFGTRMIFVFNRLKDQGDVNIISSAFITIPKGRNIIAYIHTPPRMFTIDYEEIMERVKKRSRVFFFLLPIAKSFFNIYYKHSLRHAIFILSNSRTTRDRLKKFYNIESKVLYLGININEYKNLGYYNYFLYVSRFHILKRQDFAIRAFKEFYKYNKNFKLILAGSMSNNIEQIEYLNSLKELVEFEKLPVIFKLNATKSEILELYSNAYLCLFTAKNEDFGIVPLEAMASGKPIISVAEGGPTETIIDGITGFLVKNEKEMAEKMLLLANNLELAKKIGVAGRKHVETNFSWSEFDKNMSNIIELIVQKTYNRDRGRNNDK